ncbi:hypothetical protein GDO81_016340 [Engystomops pustulosus]|uniref:Uncharacterized protein n=1 Tax=Engystomops pustulosus TaxID=76066 RepID=A0AAV7ARD8_ENGPU|nr:hypothetical protein GDO81_016340 [Engystomops pustulosus]
MVIRTCSVSQCIIHYLTAGVTAWLIRQRTTAWSTSQAPLINLEETLLYQAGRSQKCYGFPPLPGKRLLSKRDMQSAVHRTAYV